MFDAGPQTAHTQVLHLPCYSKWWIPIMCLSKNNYNNRNINNRDSFLGQSGIEETPLILLVW